MEFTNLNRKSKTLIMTGVMVGLLLASLDGTIVTTAMPKIISDLNGFEYYTWPLIAFFLCLTISMPLFGKLADMYGFKPIYVFGIAIFLVGSALCGLSQNMIQLIIFRGLQGIGGAILVSNSMAIIGMLFAPAERAKYIGVAFSAGIVASIVGPFLGGFITDNFSWRWVFYVNVPIGILALVIILFFLPSSQEIKEIKMIDYLGASALIIALIPMLLAFTWGGKNYDWNSIQIISMFVFSILMIITFAIIETKASDPIVPMSLFKNSVFNFSALEMFLISAIMIGAAIFIPLYIQSVIGSSASKSGAIITPMMLSLIVGAIISGLIVSKTHKYKILAIIGFLITCIGTVFLLNLGVKSSSSQVILDMIVLGFGTGIVMPIFNVTAQNAFPESQLGVVTSSIQFFKAMGQTIASSVLGTIMSTSLKDGLYNLDVSSLPASVTKVFRDPNSLSNAQAISNLKSQLPEKMLPAFAKVMEQVKQVFSDSIHVVFIICIVISALALFTVLFMKEMPLNKVANKK